MRLALEMQPPPEKTMPQTASQTPTPRKIAPKTQLKAPKIPTPKAVPIEISIELGLSWSRAARTHLPDPKMAPRLKKIIQTALQTTLEMAPPRFPALRNKFESEDSPVFVLDFSMVDDAKIEALNRQYRGKNRPTDVLSFALWEEIEAEVDEEETDEDKEPNLNGFVFPDFGPDIALGDLIISTQTAARQASEQNHSFEREIAFLTIHGALHLLGYDHHQNHARRTMFARQDTIFAAVFAKIKG